MSSRSKGNPGRRGRRGRLSAAYPPLAALVVFVCLVVTGAPGMHGGVFSGSKQEPLPQSVEDLATRVGAANGTAAAAPPVTLLDGSASPTTGDLATAPSATTAAPPQPAAPGPSVAAGNPFAGAEFYDAPNTQADNVVNGLRQSRPADAAALVKISQTPAALWVGDWDATNRVRSVVAGYVGAARSVGEVPVVVVYAIPQRDCGGGYSAGGISSPDGYRAWVAQVAAGFDGKLAAVVLEPDAIAGIDCLGASQAQQRYSLLSGAAAALTAAGATVYLDAGNAGWLSAAQAADRLRQAGVMSVRGFALNTSNYQTTAASLSYGEQVARMLGGARFVVDTSRNGLGPSPDDAWCNPAGRALGSRPTTATGNPYADALLWIKMPGESDGTCNGGPPAGQFWVDYALGLASRATW